MFTHVKSSNIEGAAYNPGTRVLAVKFKSGRVYRYSECLPWHYEGLLKAPSAGRFLNAHIKGGLTRARPLQS